MRDRAACRKRSSWRSRGHAVGYGMLRIAWRLAVGAAVVVGAGCAAVACGSSSAGENSGFIAPDASGGDGGSEGGADGGFGFGGDGEAAAPVVTSALIINAMPSSLTNDSSLRFCWAPPTSDGGFPSWGNGVLPFPSGAPMPASNFPGVALGGTALLADASALTRLTTLYAIRAEDLAKHGQGDASCAELISPGVSGGLDPNTDYFTLAPISVRAGEANVVVVQGCAGELLLAQNATSAACGSTYDPVHGNVHAEVLAAAPSAPHGGIAVQVLQLSQGLASLLVDGGTATVSLAELTPDGGAPGIIQMIATVGPEAQVAPPAPVNLALDGSLSSYASVGVRLDLPGAEAGTRSFFLTLAQAQQLVDPTMDPRVYYGGQGTYVIAIVGDPNAPAPFATGPEAGTYDGTGLHFVIAQAQGSN
jgi:hypothetical protein